MKKEVHNIMYEIGSIIRGYFYDGESSIVVLTRAMKEGELVISDKVLTLSDEEKANSWNK